MNEENVSNKKVLKSLIAYHSFSGNTKEIAECIEAKLLSYAIEVDMYNIAGYSDFPSISKYDLLFFGTFTWDRGSTPDEFKDFVADVGYKPTNILLFGSGDTQFGGDELFCGALNKLATFYNVSYPILKIEQSPRGSQEEKVESWIKGVVEDLHLFKKSG